MCYVIGFLVCCMIGFILFQTFSAGVGNLHPSPTDSCSLWLTNATVAALPSKCSRHNTPSRAHSLTRIIRSCLTGSDEYIVVSIFGL